MAATKALTASTAALPSGGTVNVMTDATVTVQKAGSTTSLTHKDLAVIGQQLQNYLVKAAKKK